MDSDVRRLARERPELGLDVDGSMPGLVALGMVADLNEPTLSAWLADAATLAAGIDPRTAAAYLISIMVWRLGDILGALYLRGAPLPALGPEQLWLRQRVHGSGRWRDLQYAFRLQTGATGQPFDRETFRCSIIDLHAPMIAGLHHKTGLSERALWRLVTDGFSAGMLEQGKRDGCIDLARSEAQAILGDPGTPLHNRQWRFVEIAPPGAKPDWFRLRGGCCRLYRTDGGEYCTTCVVRTPQSQIDRLNALVSNRGAL